MDIVLKNCKTELPAYGEWVMFWCDMESPRWKCWLWGYRDHTDKDGEAWKSCSHIGSIRNVTHFFRFPADPSSWR